MVNDLDTFQTSSGTSIISQKITEQTGKTFRGCCLTLSGQLFESSSHDFLSSVNWKRAKFVRFPDSMKME